MAQAESHTRSSCRFTKPSLSAARPACLQLAQPVYSSRGATAHDPKPSKPLIQIGSDRVTPPPYAPTPRRHPPPQSADAAAEVGAGAVTYRYVPLRTGRCCGGS